MSVTKLRRVAAVALVATFAIACGAFALGATASVRLDEVNSELEQLRAEAYVAQTLVDPAEPGGSIDPSSLAEALDTPCATEDSDANCYWDAALRGNGEGSSFVVVEGHIFPMPKVG